MFFKKSFVISTALILVSSFSAYATSLSDGIALYKSGNYEKAIDVLKKASQEEPENPEPHFWLSKSYQELLELDKVFPETKIYNDLRAKKNIKDKEIAEKKALEEQKKLEEQNKFVEVNDPTKVVRINDSYINQIINKRDYTQDLKNLKYFDYKQLKEMSDSLPTDTDKLSKIYKEYQVKSHYGIATPSEILLMNKAKMELLYFDIEAKKLEISEENDVENKKVKQSDLEQLVREYNSYLEQAEKIINSPVYGNFNSFSYDYFLASESSPDTYIQNLEDKKSEFKKIIDLAKIDIISLKKGIERQEKDIISKRQVIDPKIIDADIRTLFGDEKEKVSLYQSFRDKLESDKTKMKNLMIENEILINAYNSMNETIKIIKPDYIIK